MPRAGLLLALMSVGTASAQTSPRPIEVAISLGAQSRTIRASDESRVGVVGDLMARRLRERLAFRASLGAAHFTSSNPYVGRLCSPDGPCEYYAPALTVVTAAIGTEWGSRRGPRALLGIGAYQLLSRQAQGASFNVPSARRGVRHTAGAQVGIVLPLPGGSDHVELEVRYERLAQALESTTYLLPMLVRIHW
jgi:hypothetical protein